VFSPRKHDRDEGRVMNSLPEDAGAGPLALGALSRFRRDFHACLTARVDELSDLADAALARGADEVVQLGMYHDGTAAGPIWVSLVACRGWSVRLRPVELIKPGGAFVTLRSPWV
jgi:hypothetical protein